MGGRGLGCRSRGGSSCHSHRHWKKKKNLRDITIEKTISLLILDKMYVHKQLKVAPKRGSNSTRLAQILDNISQIEIVVGKNDKLFIVRL